MVAKGSIVKVDYTAWTEEGELFDTTLKSVAKEHSAYREDAVYEPLPVVVGAARVIPGFDRALLEAQPGEERTVHIPAADAYGERDPSKVETHSLRKFQERDVEPRPGMRVTVEGKPGTIIAVTPGRVRIDFNPPFAGKGLKYTFKIASAIDDPVEQVRTLIDLDYGLGRQRDFGVEREGDVVTIKLPDSCKYDQRWFVAKYRVVADLRMWAGVKTVRFVEEYLTEEPKTEAAQPAAPTA